MASQQARTITLTLNPAIDRSGTVDALQPGHKLRCRDERLDPGGGGINVARLLTRLGADPLAVFPVGGPTGALLTQMVGQENVAFDAVALPWATRENFNVRDGSTGAQYRFIFPGPQTTAGDIATCCAAALKHVSPGSFFIASGSAPPGAPDDTYAGLARQVNERGGRFVLDTSGPALLRALGPYIDILKVSESELGAISPAPLCDRDHCIAAARLLLLSGPRMIAVTRGNKGALLVTDQENWEAEAPTVIAGTSVGAGDCFLAGLVWGLMQGEPVQEALRLAVAAGTAALMQQGTGLSAIADIRELANGICAKPLHQKPAAEFAA